MNNHIVFDLDWTLADTQKIHQRIESDFLASKWIHIDPVNIWKKYAGRSPIEWIPELLIKSRISFETKDIDDFVHWKDEKVIALLNQWEISLMPFAKETLEKLSKKWYKIWISSGACREFIDDFIKYFVLWMIEASTSADEVENKKPAPDVFLKSFMVLENKYWKPIKKYVVWDWRSDIIGWHKAWAISVLFNNSNIPTGELDTMLNFEIRDLNELLDFIS